MNKENEGTDSTTTVGNTAISRRIVWIIVITILLILITMLILISRNNQSQKNNQQPTIESVDRKSAAQNHDGSIEELRDALENTSDITEEYNYMYRLGTNYFYAQDWDNAVFWMEKARSTGQPGSENMSLNIAIAAENAGDIPKAIDEYAKVIELLGQDDSTSSKMQIEIYEKKIKELKKQ